MGQKDLGCTNEVWASEITYMTDKNYKTKTKVVLNSVWKQANPNELFKISIAEITCTI